MRFFHVSQRDVMMKLYAVGLLIGGLLISVSIYLISIIPDTKPRIMETLVAMQDCELIFGNRMKIELRKGSKIIYPTKSNGTDLDVALIGEGKFKIMRGYRLFMEYGEIIIEATDADFSIAKGDSTVDVIVNSNQVSIVAGKQSVVVRAFQRATYNVSTKQVTIKDTEIERT